MARRTALIATIVLTCLAGCGDENPRPVTTRDQPAAPQRLTGAQRRAADDSVAEIRRYCRRLARRLATGGRPPDQGRAVAAAGRVAALAAARPSAPYKGSQTMRDLAGDLAEDLEGTNCSARLVAELERGLTR